MGIAQKVEPRVIAALAAVLPPGAQIEPEAPVGHEPNRRFDIRIGNTYLEVKWVPRGWPADVSRAIALANQLREAASRAGLTHGHLVIVAPEMSPGARSLLEQQGIGWVDETGAGNIVTDSMVVSRDRTDDSLQRSLPQPAKNADPVGVSDWRVATLAVAEALMLGVRPTQAAVANATGLSTATAARDLALMAKSALLTADAERGARSARRLSGLQPLLTAYVAAERRLASRYELRVAVLWRDPLASAAALIADHPGSMATGSLAAAAMAPYLGEVTTSEIYLPVDSVAELRVAAAAAGLRSSAGGRLLLRSTPGRGTEALVANLLSGIEVHTGGLLRCAPWPRVFADLRKIGVRGEEAADHLLSLQPNPSDGELEMTK